MFDCSLYSSIIHKFIHSKSTCTCGQYLFLARINA